MRSLKHWLTRTKDTKVGNLPKNILVSKTALATIYSYDKETKRTPMQPEATPSRAGDLCRFAKKDIVGDDHFYRSLRASRRQRTYEYREHSLTLGIVTLFCV